MTGGGIINPDTNAGHRIGWGTRTRIIKNILFDLDGTLTDPKEGIVRCIRYALTRLGTPCPDETELQTYIGPPLRGTFSAILNSTDRDLVERAIGLYRERFSETGLFENGVYEGVPEMLEALCGSSRKLYVATSKLKIYAERVLSHFQLAGYFEEVYGGTLDGSFDDKADLIRHLLQSEALDPLETLMVGDRKYDVVGAKRNLCSALGVTYGYGTEMELAEAGADFICQSPRHVADFLRE